MSTAERDAKILELAGQSESLREKIQANTDAARKLNAENHGLLSQRREIERAIHALKHVKVNDGAE